MGYIIWPNEELGGAGSRVATYCLSKPAYPPKKGCADITGLLLSFAFQPAMT